MELKVCPQAPSSSLKSVFYCYSGKRLTTLLVKGRCLRTEQVEVVKKRKNKPRFKKAMSRVFVRVFSQLSVAAAFFSGEQLRYGQLYESSNLILVTT